MEKGLLRGRLEGIQEGIREGIREGMQQTKQQIAENLLRQGIATDLVANATGLFIDELKQVVSDITE